MISPPPSPFSAVLAHCSHCRPYKSRAHRYFIGICRDHTFIKSEVEHKPENFHEQHHQSWANTWEITKRLEKNAGFLDVSCIMYQLSLQKPQQTQAVLHPMEYIVPLQKGSFDMRTKFFLQTFTVHPRNLRLHRRIYEGGPLLNKHCNWVIFKGHRVNERSPVAGVSLEAELNAPVCDFWMPHQLLNGISMIGRSSGLVHAWFLMTIHLRVWWVQQTTA